MSYDTPENTDTLSGNGFLVGRIAVIYAKTALPVIFVMGMSGLLAIVDALFLGHFVGPDALASVTLMFPLYMMIVSLSTLVAGGMSSLLARHLGAGRRDEARAVFAGAHGLALFAGMVLILLFFLFGRWATVLAAGGAAELAAMGSVYLRIMVLSSPLIFALSLHSDALRSEGKTGFMAVMSLLVSLANIGFNYILIVPFGMGVAGSAYGTVLAQALALAIICCFRWRGRTHLHLSLLLRHRLDHGWWRIVALGAPQSLGFMGIALGSAAIIAAIQMAAKAGYADTVSAYGIVTRVMTFTFLPLLGLSYAMQSIVGNNYGAGQWHRTNHSLNFALLAALGYCAVAQFFLISHADHIGSLFVGDPAVGAEVARILPVIVSLFILAGPLMMLGAYFQAIGDAGRAALLGLAKPYLFALPMTLILPQLIGEKGIWIAGPAAEGLLLLLSVSVLYVTAGQGRLRWGLYHPLSAEVRP